MKNIREKIIKIQNFYESQKFYIFYNYEAIKSTTNAIIKITWII